MHLCHPGEGRGWGRIPFHQHPLYQRPFFRLSQILSQPPESHAQAVLCGISLTRTAAFLRSAFDRRAAHQSRQAEASRRSCMPLCLGVSSSFAPSLPRCAIYGLGLSIRICRRTPGFCCASCCARSLAGLHQEIRPGPRPEPLLQRSHLFIARRAPTRQGKPDL